jgi:hypothetical protein
MHHKSSLPYHQQIFATVVIGSIGLHVSMNFEQTMVSGAEVASPLAATHGWREIAKGRNLKNM